MVSQLYRIRNVNDIKAVKKMGLRISGPKGSLLRAFRKGGVGSYYHRGKGYWCKYSTAKDLKHYTRNMIKNPRLAHTGDYTRSKKKQKVKRKMIKGDVFRYV